MSKSNALETGWLDLVFLGTPAITGIAQNVTSGAVTALAISLHTADPGEAGTQATSETTYGGYTRVTVARGSGGWTRTGSSVSPNSAINFPACTSGTATITHFGIGTNATAGQAGLLLYKGSISPTIGVSTGVAPQLTTSTAITED